MGSGGTAPQFLTSGLDESEWLASRPGRFNSGERAPGIHCIRNWVDLRDGLEDVDKREIVHPLGIKPGCSARSPLL
jgi:hypothetical protein